MQNQHFSNLDALLLDHVAIGDTVSIVDLRPNASLSVFTGEIVQQFEATHCDSYLQTTVRLAKLTIQSDHMKLECLASDIGLCRDLQKNFSPHMFTVWPENLPDADTLASYAKFKQQLSYRSPVFQWEFLRLSS